MPSSMEARMPGTDGKGSVSRIVCQSSAASSTTLVRLPVISTGRRDSAVRSMRRWRFARLACRE